MTEDGEGNPALGLENAEIRFVCISDGRPEGLDGVDVLANDRQFALDAALDHALPVEENTVTTSGMRFRLILSASDTTYAQPKRSGARLGYKAGLTKMSYAAAVALMTVARTRMMATIAAIGLKSIIVLEGTKRRNGATSRSVVRMMASLIGWRGVMGRIGTMPTTARATTSQMISCIKS